MEIVIALALVDPNPTQLETGSAQQTQLGHPGVQPLSVRSLGVVC